MLFNGNVRDIIAKRYSCRSFRDEPVCADDLRALNDCVAECAKGPFGGDVRLAIIAAEKNDTAMLKGLGTYGFIKNPQGFIIGAVKDSGMALEDFGYVMETFILYATGLGIGTCWLGGTFTRSSFAQRISLENNEVLPAVAAFGYPADRRRMLDSVVRWKAGSNYRKAWSELFFSTSLETPLRQSDSGIWAEPLEMLRRAPSASNKQPWRVVMRGDGEFDFYLMRTKGYRERNKTMLAILDLQRVDMGIAMSHFEYTAREIGLDGGFTLRNPAVAALPGGCEYIVTWRTKI